MSVGEVYVAMRFMAELRTLKPGSRFVLTTTTSTGHRLAESRLASEDVLLYFPADFPIIIRRVLGTLRPAAILLTECELWPNLIRMASERQIPVILINGRISASSERGYRMARLFFRRVVRSMPLFLIQTEAEKRFLLLRGT